MGSVETLGLFTKMLMTTSSMDMAKARSDPDMTAGKIRGRVISQECPKRTCPQISGCLLQRRIHAGQPCFYLHQNIRYTEYGMSDKKCQHSKGQIQHIEKSHQYHTKYDFRYHQRQYRNISQNSLCFPVNPG